MCLPLSFAFFINESHLQKQYTFVLIATTQYTEFLIILTKNKLDCDLNYSSSDGTTLPSPFFSLLISIVTVADQLFLYLSAVFTCSSSPKAVRRRRWRSGEMAWDSSASMSTMKASWLRFVSPINHIYSGADPDILIKHYLILTPLRSTSFHFISAVEITL